MGFGENRGQSQTSEVIIHFCVLFSGYEILFQQAKLTLTIPVVESQRQYLDKNPIIKLKVLDMTSSSNSTVTFRLEESYDFLQLDKLTGQLWFKQESWKTDSRESYSIVISAEKSDGYVARMTLDLHVTEVEDISEFCERFMCFYESVTYHTIEDYNESFKSHEVGEISPKIYAKLCKNLKFNYELLNCKSITHFMQTKPIKILPFHKKPQASLPSRAINYSP